MSEHAEILRSAAELTSSGVPFVLVTVIRIEGSTPRDLGARMIWRPDVGLLGTVGGGEFERMVSDAAEERFRMRSSGQESFTLGRDAGQCCGGRMEVFLEFIGPGHRLVIFGAGHVAGALYRALERAPFEIVIVDDRTAWNTAERFPTARRLLDVERGLRLAHERPDATLVCVMTCSHDTDFAIMKDLLAHPPAFVGLIGSASKRASFFSRLASLGIAQDVLDRVHCPIGLGDMGKAPELVAISIAGQLLLEAKTLVRL